MEFEKTGQTEHPYKLIFVGEEIDIVSAAFKEHIYDLARSGNSRSISSFDVALAGWVKDEDGDKRPVLVRTFGDVADRLEKFHSSTDDAIMELRESTGVPVYLNKHIPIRHELGRKATELAIMMRTVEGAQISEEEIDAGLRRILSGD